MINIKKFLIGVAIGVFILLLISFLGALVMGIWQMIECGPFTVCDPTK